MAVPQHFLSTIREVHWGGTIELAPLSHLRMEFSPITTPALTLSVWMNVDVAGGGFAEYGTISTALADGNEPPIAFGFDSATTPPFSLATFVGPGESPPNIIIDAETTVPALPVNQWHHFFLGVTPTQASFYVDGAPITATASESGASSILLNRISIASYRYYLGDDNPQQRLRLSDFQLWTGQSIDPAVHIGKFVRIEDGIRKRVDPTIPAESFGPPRFRFSGGQTAFLNNRGLNGGALAIVSGSTANYSPVPPRFIEATP